MRDTIEGTRRQDLIRYTVELARQGVDATCLETAAIGAGLPAKEIASMTQATQMAYEVDSMKSRVKVWIASHEGRVPPASFAVMQAVGQAAIAQNTLSPYIVQADMTVCSSSGSSMLQAGISKCLRRLDKYGALKIIRPQGWRNPTTIC